MANKAGKKKDWQLFSSGFCATDRVATSGCSYSTCLAYWNPQRKLWKGNTASNVSVCASRKSRIGLFCPGPATRKNVLYRATPQTSFDSRSIDERPTDFVGNQQINTPVLYLRLYSQLVNKMPIDWKKKPATMLRANRVIFVQKDKQNPIIQPTFPERFHT